MMSGQTLRLLIGVGILFSLITLVGGCESPSPTATSSPSPTATSSNSSPTGTLPPSQLPSPTIDQVRCVEKNIKVRINPTNESTGTMIAARELKPGDQITETKNTKTIKGTEMQQIQIIERKNKNLSDLKSEDLWIAKEGLNNNTKPCP